MAKTVKWMLAVALAGGLPLSQGCELEPCSHYSYSPHSMTVYLMDTDADEMLCDATAVVTYVVEKDAGPSDREQALYPLADDECGYQFPGWERTVGTKQVTLQVDGYEPVSFKIKKPGKDECGLPAVPDPRTFEITPGGSSNDG